MASPHDFGCYRKRWQYFLAITTIHMLPTPQHQRLRQYTSVVHHVGKAIIKTETKLYSPGEKSGEDCMSILKPVLVRANLYKEPKLKLTGTEAMTELKLYPTVAIEGTTVLTLPWALYELSRNREIQNCVWEETGQLALTQHNKTTENSIKLPAFLVSSDWGGDAAVWRPERFIDGVESKQKIGHGVVYNSATFSSGIRKCTGRATSGLCTVPLPLTITALRWPR
ncbi:hypothetical protein JB92DRAFT_2831045 [Gautieria morchelliformis]|nr:hypothetical protein JB92DRAFT_2831045 [Gautieria morchelliformis]